MVLNEKKELSFKKKRTRRHLLGSAAESEVRPPNMGRFREHFWPPKALFERTKVRPPNMHEFRGHVRLPKVDDQATYKEPSDRKWASFLPIPELSGFEEFSSLDQVLGTWRPKELVSPIPKLELEQTLDLQEVSVDLCFPLRFMKF